MAGPGRQCLRDTTLHLIFLVFITTLGPLQFGYHIVRLKCYSSPVVESC